MVVCFLAAPHRYRHPSPPPPQCKLQDMLVVLAHNNYTGVLFRLALCDGGAGRYSRALAHILNVRMSCNLHCGGGGGGCIYLCGGFRCHAHDVYLGMCPVQNGVSYLN